VSSFIISIWVFERVLYVSLIVSLSFAEMFRRIEKTNIGGAFGLIRVSKSWMYAEIFSLIARRISLSRNDVSLSWIFSMSKSSARFLNSGSSCSFLISLYSCSKSNSLSWVSI